MARALLLAVFAVLVVGLSARGIRVRRGYNNSGYGTSGYGRGSGSDERDASVSQDGNGCNGGGDNGRGYGNSGSHELAYKNGRSSEHIRGGRSYAHSSASASASSTALNQNKKGHLFNE
ncbi:hypothetical protein ABMA27_007052 [Loxostege sticticalis]|uniref:Uncharacterized protein n=1 Tax=Loxostege sticticalis TaxID=481309 RepID=A0ABR3ILD2_LOXSC